MSRSATRSSGLGRCAKTADDAYHGKGLTSELTVCWRYGSCSRSFDIVQSIDLGIFFFPFSPVRSLLRTNIAQVRIDAYI
jgi:hypothetical protein